jgi:hypothetical protein
MAGAKCAEGAAAIAGRAARQASADIASQHVAVVKYSSKSGISEKFR